MNGSIISVIGAKEHNLKNINLKIPRDQLVVFTGVSGSGKSSLAFDTLYAEGQRRYVESLSSYARQFLEQMKKPDVESIDGLSAAIAIEQQSISKNPRSTVGTVTELYDFLRLLFSRIGRAACPRCKKEISTQNAAQITENIMALPKGEKIAILAPIVRERKGEYQKEIYQLRQSGYLKVKIDGQIRELSEKIQLDKNRKHSIDVIIDRLILKPGIERRLSASIDTALGLSKHLVRLEREHGQEILLSTRFACIDCGTSFPEIEPRLFSFNSPLGFCKQCSGTGLKDLLEEVDEWLLSEERLALQRHPCAACNGKRLRPEALAVTIQWKSIADVCAWSLDKTHRFFLNISLSGREKLIADRILKEICDRLSFLINVGVGYLTLDRRSATLSGGEGRRIRLAAQIGSPLVGVLYVLDEPSIGLHPKDNKKLIDSLKALRDHGNTILVVEHDKEMIVNADYIFDLGPGAGRHGGKVVAEGSLTQLMRNSHSLTGAYLSGQKEIPLPLKRRKPNGKFIQIDGARENNLKDISVRLPLGLFTCVTGVSGSGKSTLVIDTLYQALSRKCHRSKVIVGAHKRISGLEQVEQVIDVDQSPIGRTPRSNPATYTGIFSYVRNFFAQLPESKIRGYKPGRYSFNISGGRCETCMGAGLIKMEMHFLPHMVVPCELCQEQRYNRETLEIRYREKNISDILNMTVDEALIFFNRIPQIKSKLKTLQDVGLGYIHVGQQATTLSGGEAQRVKLSKELSKKGRGKTLTILDEPTTGLHFEDIKKLLAVLQTLVDFGNTVIVIEHNLDVIKSCDHIIDLGPEGGEAGGRIVAEGTPEGVSKNPSSYTGQFLKRILE